MKRMLIVSYHFPPDSAVGGLRALKFAKYLPECGWRPYVLTVKEQYCESPDPSRISDVITPEQVYRTRVWPDPGVLYVRLKKRLFELAGKRHVFERQSNAPDPADSPTPPGPLQRLRRVLFSLLAVASGKLGWVPSATIKAVLLIKRHRIDGLYTTGPPHAAHLVGLAAKRLTGVKWVADFRDPWTLLPPGTKYPGNPPCKPIDTWLERLVVEHADTVVSVTERMRQAFRIGYPHVEAEKFVTIPNGYDPADFQGLSRSRRNGTFRISYLGTFYMRRTPEHFLRAVKELIDEGVLCPGSLEIKFIGTCRFVDGQPVDTMVEQMNLSSITEIRDPLPYRKALQVMMDSQVLLLLAPSQDDQVPGKTFEYLASGADVIAVTSRNGATANVLRTTARGFVVEPGSVTQMKEALTASYRRVSNGGLEGRSVSDAALRMYDRRMLTGQLAELLA